MSLKRGYSETNNLRRETSISRYTGPTIDEENLLDNDSNYSRNVRQRVDVNVPPINVPSNNDIIQLLSQIGSNISLVADAQRQPPERTESNFETLKSELMLVLVNAFENAQNQVQLQEQNRQEAETMGMDSEEASQHELLKRQFFADLEPLTRQMSETLTYGEQARMFRIIIEALRERINNYNINRNTQIETDHLDRVAEIASIAYSWASTQLSVTITNVYSTAPDVTKKLMAIITSIGIIYNYLPEGIRTPLINVPYLGNLFGLMNRYNNDALLIQNSAATVTSLYYLLRNSGMDPTESINSLSSMATATSISCARTTASYARRSISQVQSQARTSGTFICKNVSGAIDSIRQSAEIVLNNIASRLGDVITADYNNFAINNSQGDSQLTDNTLVTQASFMSNHTVNVNENQNSLISEQSIEIAESLLNTPVPDGGIDVGGFMSNEVIEERFNPILEGLVTAPIIASPVNMVESVDAVPVAETFSSDSSVDSSEDMNWGIWLFGRSHAGGRRFRNRKSRRNKKLMKTKKGKGKRRSTRRSIKRSHRRRRSRKMYSR